MDSSRGQSTRLKIQRHPLGNEKPMKPYRMKPTLALLVALLLVVAGGPIVAVGPAAAAEHVLDWRVIGSGDVGGTCPTELVADCTLTSSGSADTVSVLGQRLGNSTYTFSVEAGFTSLDNTTAAGVPPGHCFAAAGTGTVTAANGDVINFNTVGLLCEEGGSGSALQYNGTYRITGGTGRFASAVGGGSLTATFTRDTGVAFIKIDGVINF